MLFCRYIFLGRKPSNFLVSKSTDICIEGYPSSANSNSVRMFKEANECASIGHHTNSIANIKMALKYKIPIICIFREPEQAIASKCIYDNKINTKFELKSYIHSYEYILKYEKKIILVPFEKVMYNFNLIIEQVNKKYNLNFNLINDLRQADSKVKHEIYIRYKNSSLVNKAKHRAPFPNSERLDSKRNIIKEIMESSLRSDAVNLYKKII